MAVHTYKSAITAIKRSESGMTEEQFDFLFEHYCDNGEMPYGVAKARTGDPYEWILDKVEQE
jgi:hypothetical protein